MQEIMGWKGMEFFGINALTGEADAYSMRLLCDLNEDGVRLIQTYFGLQEQPHERMFCSNYNSQVNRKEAVSSIMLPRYLWRELGMFALFHVCKCRYILEDTGNRLMGFSEGDEYGDRWLKHFKEERMPEGYQLWHNPRPATVDPKVTQGDRNVHQFSGKCAK